MALFHLNEDPKMLKAYAVKMSALQTQQRGPATAINAGSFSLGKISFPFTVSGSRWWIPAKSTMRMRFNLQVFHTVPNAQYEAPLSTDNLAFAMNPIAGMMQSCQFKIRGVSTSFIPNYVQQVSTYQQRCMKSEKWLEGTGMQYVMDPSFENRQSQIISDVNNVMPVLKKRTYNFTEFGFVAGANVEVAVVAPTNNAPGTVTFTHGAAGVLPDLRTFLQIGDVVTIQGTGANNNIPYTFTINGFATGTQIVFYQTTSPAPPAAGAPGTQLALGLFTRTSAASLPYPNGPYGTNTVEFEWQPPLSMFMLPHALPSMSCELILTPQSYPQYVFGALESKQSIASKVQSPSGMPLPADGNILLSVVDFFLYTTECDSELLPQGSYLLDLQEITLQTQKMTSSQQQIFFDVSPSVYQFGFFWQNANAGVDGTNTQSKFVVSTPPQRAIDYAANPLPSGFASGQAAQGPVQGLELCLTNFFYQFGGGAQPQPNRDPQYDFVNSTGQTVPVGGTLVSSGGALPVPPVAVKIQQEWQESQQMGGNWLNPGSDESIYNWIQRGMMFNFPALRAGGDKSTRVQITTTFNPRGVDVNGFAAGTFTGLTQANFPQLCPFNSCLMSCCRQVAQVTVSDGAVVDLNVQEQ
jgi:hypothetical protein